jgi:hypothetical protein
MSDLLPTAPTVGEIARRLNVPLHRVEYVIRSRGISPTTRAGNIRVFSESDVRRIGSELDRIAAERTPETPEIISEDGA